MNGSPVAGSQKKPKALSAVLFFIDPITSATTGIADWQTCYPGSTYCINSAAVCCIASGDGSKYTCRPNGANCQSFAPSPALTPSPAYGIADWQTCYPGSTYCTDSAAVRGEVEYVHSK
ncbi:hypothetical protein M427DRAFT_477554 [Gonapodya prolifera JEL478]|uniref:Uncharacterized protein n=1 Tax=Gonapodya prolifera (strain JEL478) TaxID=1344416 RepID=A0A139A1K5_GONPJ|nr:hypothetical protein M427DRAFT_477554 [Gonapodya prolifera JEL478]|eukprot:KXS10508.1 hypothetical protein M427DRAFT_477554 [Gonapodya prolifera JEL478]